MTGMVPLGAALDSTGAARYLATGVVDAVGGFGPTAVMAGPMILAFMATCVIPTAALVVLMVPIILSTAADTGVPPYPMMMGHGRFGQFHDPHIAPAQRDGYGPGRMSFCRPSQTRGTPDLGGHADRHAGIADFLAVSLTVLYKTR